MKITHFVHFLNTAVAIYAQHLRQPTPAPLANATPLPWADLLQTLSDGSYSTNEDPFVKGDDWLDQCMRIWSIEEFGYKSNWNLMDQPSGLCMNTASCAYENCTGPLQDAFGYDWIPRWMITKGYDPALFPDEIFLNDDRLNLPELVVHPKHVGDIAQTIKFANRHKIGISVKTSGHSYTGSSTKKNTILLNLRKLKSYSGQVKEGSLVECELLTEFLEAGSFADACNLAIARNKPAVIRVGGGEVWNDVLDAVSVKWNCGTIGDLDNTNVEHLISLRETCQSPNENKYHIVSGAAATVSAAGGWLSSGGLSANNGMRTYGLGVDQVLHFEMVLPDGRHVRFGPTKWDNVPGYLYPQTKEVTGYCNNGDLSADDESLWLWEECEEPVDFESLWYAVRGGGGGAYGVTTAVYYQLHHYPGSFNFVQLKQSDYVDSLEDGEEKIAKMAEVLKYANEFYYHFFFNPETIGVSKEASNLCSCPDCQGFRGGLYMCYGKGGEVLIAAAKRFVGSNKFGQLFKVEGSTLESYVHNMIIGAFGFPKGTIPKGKGKDSPQPVPMIYASTSEGHMNIPISIMQSEESRQKLIDILAPCILNLPSCDNGNYNGITYIMGGNIPFSGDGMDALPMHRRNGSLFGRPADDEIYNKLLDLFYHAEDGTPVTGDNFPGSLCHNHASFLMGTPQRDDWTKLCELEWNDPLRHEKCFTFQEATLGVENVRKLENIHSMVDPNRLFDCADCVGYDDEEHDGNKKKDKKGKKGKKKDSHKNYPTYCLTGDVGLIGDGICHEALNTQACHYDGGDCN